MTAPIVHTITRLPETLVGVQFQDADDMLYALAASASYGYTGEVTLYSSEGQPAYRLRLNNLAQGDQFGFFGDWVILHSDNRAEILTDAAFLAAYAVTP
jgi:hypothetical protein